MPPFAQFAKQIPILLFISIDGFRHDYLSQTYTPNMFELSRDATVGNMRSMYITKTFPNHFSMVTGLYEDEHEIINNHMFDPRLNESFKAGNSESKWWDPKGTSMPIWIANELYGGAIGGHKRFSGCMMYPGSETLYAGNQLPAHLVGFDKKRNWTENVNTVISWLTHKEKPANLVTMYFDEPDNMAHAKGPWAEETLGALRKVDSAIGYLVDGLSKTGLISKTNIIFVSDHGMAEVRSIVYLSDAMNTTTIDMFGASPDWSVFVKAEFRHLKSKIYLKLKAASEKLKFQVYKREDISLEYHYSKTPRVGDFFILVDRGIDLYKDRAAKPKFTYPSVWGNHGWDPEDPDMWPLFMAYGPSFKSNYKHTQKFPNIDLFPLMLHLLDLPASNLPNNATLDSLLDILDEAGQFGIHTNNPMKRKYIYILQI